MLRARTTNFKLIGKKKGYYVKVMWEAFVPFHESTAEVFINNQRYYAAIGYQLSDRFRYELFYIWQKSRRFSDDGFQTSVKIIQLRLFPLLICLR